SRRRHTRSKRDWSSDVCSSDLDRPQSARELLSAVHRCYTKFSTEARSRRRRSTLAAVGATLLIPAIALGAWLFQRSKSSAEMEQIGRASCRERVEVVDE